MGPDKHDRGAGQSLGLRLRPSLSSGCKAHMNSRELRAGGALSSSQLYLCLRSSPITEPGAERRRGQGQFSVSMAGSGLQSPGAAGMGLAAAGTQGHSVGAETLGKRGVAFPGSSNGTDKTIVQVY